MFRASHQHDEMIKKNDQRTYWERLGTTKVLGLLENFSGLAGCHVKEFEGDPPRAMGGLDRLQIQSRGGIMCHLDCRVTLGQGERCERSESSESHTN